MTALTAPRRPRPTWRAALAGVLAAGVAVAVGELLAGLIDGARSLVIAVGDQVIDLVPSPVKEFAIATFGTNDKVALLAGIGVLLTLFAAAVGVAGVRRFSVGALGVVLFDAVSAVAAVNQSFGVS
ncbi:MAG: molybdopterin-binding oxidoreductase, partial [Actinomycetota bacterium]|nr:molybdopterin-binding oxidoreductase [Actinomycetota bacterium]